MLYIFENHQKATVAFTLNLKKSIIQFWAGDGYNVTYMLRSCTKGETWKPTERSLINLHEIEDIKGDNDGLGD